MSEALHLYAFAIGALLAVALGGFGVHDTYVAAQNGTQLQISCADYATKRPDASWLRLTDCEYDLAHYAIIRDPDDSSKVEKVYLELRPVGAPKALTHIVVERRDDEMLRVIDWLEHGSGHLAPEPAYTHVAEQLGRPTEGLVKFGIDLAEREKSDLKKLDLDLAPDFVIVDNGARPSLVRGLILLGIGAILLGACAFFFVREIRKQATPKAGPKAAWRRA